MGLQSDVFFCLHVRWPITGGGEGAGGLISGWLISGSLRYVFWPFKVTLEIGDIAPLKKDQDETINSTYMLYYMDLILIALTRNLKPV